MTDSAKPRVLVLTSTYPRWQGDPEPGFVHELSKRLTRDFDVTVLGPAAAGAKSEERLEGVRVLRYRYAPSRMQTLVNDGGIVANLRRSRWKLLLVPFFLGAMAWSTWRTVVRERPDVIHAHWLIPQGGIVALLRKLDRRTPRALVTSHGADLFALQGRLWAHCKRKVIGAAAAITVVSQVMAEEVARLQGAVRVEVRPMGVDLRDRFTPDDSVARSTDELLFVGRLVEKKGLAHLLDAMPLVLRVRPGVTLTVAGFGPEADALRKQVETLGLEHCVRFIGAVRQNELPALYRRAALFVAPFVQAGSGDQEGLGLVVVEALGCGCPCVVSDLPATRMVLPGERQPARVPPGDPVALASAIVHALGRSDAREVRDLLPALRAQFDWSEVACGYADLLKVLVSKSA